MSQELVMDRNLEDAKQFARLLYIGHALTFFFSAGTLSVLLLIVNYIKRPDTKGTMVYSHHSWMIRTFWIYVVCAAIAWLFALTFFGIPLALVIWGAAWLWSAYRLIKGFIDLNNNRPMPE